MSAENAPGAGDWSVIVPFFNEADGIARTLESLARQTLAPSSVILVDNGSTDNSRGVVADVARRHPNAGFSVIEERTPGKASALKRGLAAVQTEFVATCDADTYYPPSYLETANGIFARKGDRAVAVLAFGVACESRSAGALARFKGAVAARLMPDQAHSGGYGQSFRTKILRDVGGFGPDIWPFCLMDHEVMHRVGKFGELHYDFEHWCRPSARRASRTNVRWTVAERLLYHVTPPRDRDWFFYHFLRRRFEMRGMSELNLRQKPWLAAQAARRSDLSLTSEA